MSRILYACALFAGSALLFVIEPLQARLVLPRLGGTPAVWTTCLVFFQAVLLAGYAWAHLVASRLGARRGAALHLAVLAAPWAALPLGVPAGWAPDPERGVALELLRVLLLGAGLPFLVVSMTAPLLQSWYARTPGAKDPYFLYAASNAGSLAGLLAYPALLEPLLDLEQQSRFWSAGYAVLCALVAACAALVLRAPDAAESAAAAPPEPIGWGRRLRWVALAAVPSSLLLGVTTHLTTDVASVPLLWVGPLALYLLSFVIAFSPGVPPGIVARATPLAAIVLAVALAFELGQMRPGGALAVHLVGFFVLALGLHLSLAHDRPGPARLTEFYLLVSAGGVVGGLFNALLAPVIFDRAREYPIALVAGALLIRGDAKGRRSLDVLLPVGVLVASLALLALGSNLPGQLRLALAFGLPVVACVSFSRRPVRFGLGIAAILLAASIGEAARSRRLLTARSFFAIHDVSVATERAPSGATRRYHLLANGTTDHGCQLIDESGAPTAATEPLAYYGRSGPAGDVLARKGLRRIALVGLGTGTLAAYAQAGQTFEFFEIDPVVRDLAEDPRWFTYLSEARKRGAKVEVVLGDARLTLARAPAGAFDAALLDAFSSDAVPVHLLTREAIELYLSKLAPGGLLAFHVSSRHLELDRVLGDTAGALGLAARVRKDEVDAEERARGHRPSLWVALARTEADLGTIDRDPRWRPLEARRASRVWTDSFSNVLSAIKR